MFVQEQQRKSNETKVHEAHEYRHVRPGAGCIGKVGDMQQDHPGWNYQDEHDDVFTCESEVLGIDKVYQKVGKEERNNGDDNVQQCKKRIMILSLTYNFCHGKRDCLNY